MSVWLSFRRYGLLLSAVWSDHKALVLLLSFPFLLLLVIGCFAGIAGGNAPISNRSLKKMFLSCYWDGAAFGELCGMAAVVVLFYGINGILGFNLDWVNIAIYFIAVLYAHYTFYRYACLPYYNTFSYHKPHRPVPLILPVFVLVFVTFLFMLFTFYPPHIGLFPTRKMAATVCPPVFLPDTHILPE